MGLCKWLFIGFLALVAYLGFEITRVPPLPEIPDTYWGKGRPKPDNVGIYPFTINVTDAVSPNL